MDCKSVPFAFLCLGAIGCDASSKPSAQRLDELEADEQPRLVPQDTSDLLSVALDTLRARNPLIGVVEVVGRTNLEPAGLGQILIVHGIRADQYADTNKPNWTYDELFLVARTSASGDSIVSVFDAVPTARWRDYLVYVESITPDSIVIGGRGEAYGDSEMRRAYPWHEPGVARWVRVADVAPGGLIVSADSSAIAFFRSLNGERVVPQLGPGGLENSEVTVISRHDDWLLVQIQSPPEPACGEEPLVPVERDTAWVRLFSSDKRKLVKGTYGSVC